MTTCTICGCEARVGRAAALEDDRRVRFDFLCVNRHCANYRHVFAQKTIEAITAQGKE